MAKFHFTNKAVEDLTSIWNYTLEKWSEQQADDYYGMLITACRKIASGPSTLGRCYKEITDGILGYKTGKHILFYQILENGDVCILRILHESMDLSNRIKKG